MRKLLTLLLIFIIYAGTSYGQLYIYSMGNNAGVSDTLVGNTPDTTGIFNLYKSSVTKRPGDPTFEVYMTALGTNTTHSILECELWVTSKANSAKDANGWMYVKTYYSYDMGDWNDDMILTSGEDFIIVADTLNYIASPYARMICKFVDGVPADSTLYIIYYTADRGAQQ